MIANVNQGLVDIVKSEVTMATKIRVALQNFGFRGGDIFSYSDVEVFLKDLANAGAFDDFEDKYGEGKTYENIDRFISHNFHGVVYVENKKGIKGLIEKIGDGKYKYLG